MFSKFDDKFSDWIKNHMRVMAYIMLVFAIISWPLASFWFAAAEPQFVIALSELALIYTAVDALGTSEVVKDDENGS